MRRKWSEPRQTPLELRAESPGGQFELVFRSCVICRRPLEAPRRKVHAGDCAKQQNNARAAARRKRARPL